MKPSAALFVVPLAGAVAAALLLLEPGSDVLPAAAARAEAPATAGAGEPVLPLPRSVEGDPAKVALGEALFSERRLSRDDSVSCADCHALDAGGTDRRPVSVGVDGRKGEVNSPTVFNTGFNFAQFWDGRATTLEEQVGGPVHNPLEMDSNWDQVAAKLKAAPRYVTAFRALYQDGITGANIADAIAAFERSLITPDSRFDNWLRGERKALTTDELAGYRLFKRFGCASCHQGVNLGGNMFQKFGIFADFVPAGRPPRKSDLGRFNVTGRAEDRGVFKVPGLRNVALTAPYFHDGSVADLPAAVATMARVQLGREVSAEEVRLIVAFLGTLTGRYRGKPLELL